MREYIYGLIIGLVSLYCWEYFDIPGVWAYLTDATEQNARITGNFGSTGRRY